MASATRQRGGRRAKKNGDDAETVVVLHYHSFALRAGVADMVKLETPTKQTSEGKIIYTKKSRSDCMGMMLDGSARAIAEEIKSFGRPLTSKGPSPFPLGKIQPHQREHLERTHRFGGISVLTMVDPFNYVYVVPWEYVRGRSGMLSLEDVKKYRVMPDKYLVSYANAKKRGPGPQEGFV
jgi:hypothetical protein